MKLEKPILFNTEMVKAILDSRKSMTRRVVKGLPKDQSGCDLGIIKHSDGSITGFGFERIPYQPGDILWVRETWRHGSGRGTSAYQYKADWTKEELDWEGPLLKWKPSIHMPRAAARLFLKVANVRVERLKEITEKDAKAEGVTSYWADPHKNTPPFIGAKKEFGADLCSTRREAFQQLWDSLNAKRGYGWDVNPYVWVIEFERTENKS